MNSNLEIYFEYNSQISIQELVVNFNDGNYNSLIINDNFTDSKFITDISFVKELKNLKSLSLFTHELKDYSVINQLLSLERLKIINSQDHLVDISKINLFEINLKSVKRIKGVESSTNLKVVKWDDFQAENLTAFKNCSNLILLEVESKKLKSLFGLEKKSNLKRIVFRSCPKLIDITALIDSNIEELEFEECPKIKIDELLEFKKLKKLYLFNCKKIDFIQRMKFWFTIKDFKVR